MSDYCNEDHEHNQEKTDERISRTSMKGIREEGKYKHKHKILSVCSSEIEKESEAKNES